MEIVCLKVLSRTETGAIKDYGGSFLLDEEEAVKGIESGDYRAVGHGDGQIPEGAKAKKKAKAPVRESDAVDVGEEEDGIN